MSQRRTRLVPKENSSLNARNVGHFYFYLESLWVLLFATSIILIMAATGDGGEAYRITIFFTAFHIVALPQAMLYAFDDGKRWIILGFIMCIITDLASLLDVTLHFPEPRLYQWAWILMLLVPTYGLFISLYAFIWYAVVWARGYRFKAKRDALLPESESMTSEIYETRSNRRR